MTQQMKEEAVMHFYFSVYLLKSRKIMSVEVIHVESNSHRFESELSQLHFEGVVYPWGDSDRQKR